MDRMVGSQSHRALPPAAKTDMKGMKGEGVRREQVGRHSARLALCQGAVLRGHFVPDKDGSRHWENSSE